MSETDLQHKGYAAKVEFDENEREKFPLIQVEYPVYYWSQIFCYRSFIVYGEGNNEFKVAKTYPKLLLIQVAVNNNGDLVFTAPEQNPLIMKFPNPENKPVIITMDNKAPAETLDCGDAAATWLSQYILNKPSGIRLGYYRSQFKRNIKSQYPEYVGVYNNMRLQSAGIYTNLTSYHLINQRSIDALNKSLEEPTSANNFRPNIIVESENLEAYSEENWDWIKIGDVVLRLIRPCTRCAMTTVHPERAVYSKQREPLKSLERLNNPKQPAYLKLEGKRGVMGIQIELWKAGQIHVGDEVFIA
ncbi:molybdopterin cofactor sulfurase mosc [Holotrichia oblita]|uniref:Molybdopterin cofactor sulfurase mosc n=1 Tax=Holotrichia oblita TaxID=644536 RepID=A0ACB9SP33_HOLOL|nr:molybdopterin cofactor sulfurase mosc [Holotrichia oblita]